MAMEVAREGRGASGKKLRKLSFLMPLVEKRGIQSSDKARPIDKPIYPPKKLWVSLG